MTVYFCGGNSASQWWQTKHQGVQKTSIKPWQGIHSLRRVGPHAHIFPHTKAHHYRGAISWPGVMVLALNPSIWEAGAGAPLGGQPDLHIEFQDSQGYNIRHPVSKKKKKKKKTETKQNKKPVPVYISQFLFWCSTCKDSGLVHLGCGHDDGHFT